MRATVLGMVRTGRTMSIQITTHHDVLRHTARRVAIASSLSNPIYLPEGRGAVKLPCPYSEPD